MHNVQLTTTEMIAAAVALEAFDHPLDKPLVKRLRSALDDNELSKERLEHLRGLLNNPIIEHSNILHVLSDLQKEFPTVILKEMVCDLVEAMDLVDAGEL